MSGEQHVPPVLFAIFAAAMLLAQGSQGTPNTLNNTFHKVLIVFVYVSLWGRKKDIGWGAHGRKYFKGSYAPCFNSSKLKWVLYLLKTVVFLLQPPVLNLGKSIISLPWAQGYLLARKSPSRNHSLAESKWKCLFHLVTQLMVLLFGWNQKIKDNFALASPSTSMARIQAPPPAPGGGGRLYSEGRCNGGFFVFRFLGPYMWRGLFLEFYGT